MSRCVSEVRTTLLDLHALAPALVHQRAVKEGAAAQAFTPSSTGGSTNVHAPVFLSRP